MNLIFILVRMTRIFAFFSCIFLRFLKFIRNLWNEILEIPQIWRFLLVWRIFLSSHHLFFSFVLSPISDSCFFDKLLLDLKEKDQFNSASIRKRRLNHDSSSDHAINENMILVGTIYFWKGGCIFIIRANKNMNISKDQRTKQEIHSSLA